MVVSTPRRPLLPALLIGFCVLAVLALLGYGLLIQGRQQVGGVAVSSQFGEVPLQAKPAHDFALDLLTGPGRFALAEQRGNLVLLDFWASWCQPCRDEAAGLERVWRDYRTRGVVFVGLNVFDDRQAGLDSLKEFGISYPNAIDARGEVAIEYGLAGVPEKFLVDRQGRLVRRFVGPMAEGTLRALLDEELARGS